MNRHQRRKHDKQQARMEAAGRKFHPLAPTALDDGGNDRTFVTLESIKETCRMSMTEAEMEDFLLIELRSGKLRATSVEGEIMISTAALVRWFGFNRRRPTSS